jgi:hypothetical protein
MRKLAVLAAVCVAALAAGSAAAAGPEHLVIPVSDSFPAPFLTDACGIPVQIELSGTAHITLERNASGLVAREHDVLSSFTATFSSPLSLGGTGRSFVNRSPSVATFDYGSGATLGSTASITLVGLAGAAAGAGTSVTAGYLHQTGTVVDFSPEGVPIVDFDGPVTAQHGVWPDFFDVGLPERCAALGGTLQL